MKPLPSTNNSTHGSHSKRLSSRIPNLEDYRRLTTSNVSDTPIFCNIKPKSNYHKITSLVKNLLNFCRMVFNYGHACFFNIICASLMGHGEMNGDQEARIETSGHTQMSSHQELVDNNSGYRTYTHSGMVNHRILRNDEINWNLPEQSRRALRRMSSQNRPDANEQDAYRYGVMNQDWAYDNRHVFEATALYHGSASIDAISRDTNGFSSESIISKRALAVNDYEIRNRSRSNTNGHLINNRIQSEVDDHLPSMHHSMDSNAAPAERRRIIRPARRICRSRSSVQGNENTTASQCGSILCNETTLHEAVAHLYPMHHQQKYNAPDDRDRHGTEETHSNISLSDRSECGSSFSNGPTLSEVKASLVTGKWRQMTAADFDFSHRIESRERQQALTYNNDHNLYEVKADSSPRYCRQVNEAYLDVSRRTARRGRQPALAYESGVQNQVSDADVTPNTQFVHAAFPMTTHPANEGHCIRRISAAGDMCEVNYESGHRQTDLEKHICVDKIESPVLSSTQANLQRSRPDCLPPHISSQSVVQNNMQMDSTDSMARIQRVLRHPTRDSSSQFDVQDVNNNNEDSNPTHIGTRLFRKIRHKLSQLVRVIEKRGWEETLSDIIEA